jgi:hypothetical protein
MKASYLEYPAGELRPERLDTQVNTAGSAGEFLAGGNSA